ncbi:hypothetical protein GF362_02315 [Candidatus Dojkabacteria bacterium]|nr:hypothetical protein [Candidatus Dojkabacteria bacterium]
MHKAETSKKFHFVILLSFIVVFLIGTSLLISFKIEKQSELNIKKSGAQISSDQYETQIIAENIVETYARQKTQIYSGIYDTDSNRTFVVFSNDQKEGLSSCSPYIMYYDHNLENWSEPHKILDSPVQPDSHNYPQILKDSMGRLHVLYSMHANHKVIQATSSSTTDITNWEINEINGTNEATYGAAYKAKNGDLYYLFRKTKGNGVINPPLSNWYEPEYYLKSTDNGETWTSHKLIDPGKSEDVWNTVYTKAIHYESDPEGLHITFGIHQNHNDYFNKHYYIFFNFEDNNIYSASKHNLGSTITRSEFEQHCEIFGYENKLEFGKEGGNTRMAVDIYNNKPVIAFTRFKQINTVGNMPYTPYLEIASWDGSKWEIDNYHHLGLFQPYEIIIEDGIKQIYGRNNQYQTITKYSISNSNISETEIYTSSNLTVGQLNFIGNFTTDIIGTFIEGNYTHWSSPKPTGNLITIGKVLNSPTQTSEPSHSPTLTTTTSPSVTNTPTATVTVTSSTVKTPTPTVTVTSSAVSTPIGVICGQLDHNNNNKVDLYDFEPFKDVYSKTCSDSPIVEGCGPKDSDRNGKVDIIDFKNFIILYKQKNCG